MKRRFLIFIIILLVFIIGVITYAKIKSNNYDNENIKISVAEVTHSAFYAPLYVAIEKGYFADEKIDIELILTPGADKVLRVQNQLSMFIMGEKKITYNYLVGLQKEMVNLF